MESNLYTAVSLIPLLFLLVGLTVTVSIDPYISRNHHRVMLLIIALSIVLIAQNVLDETGFTPQSNDIELGNTLSQGETIEELEQELRICEESEDYEQAAEIQKKIEHLKGNQ